MSDLHIPEYNPHVCVPTQDAYDAACKAFAEHRERADRAEALLQKVRDHVGEPGTGEIDEWSLRELLAGREIRF